MTVDHTIIMIRDPDHYEPQYPIAMYLTSNEVEALVTADEVTVTTRPHT